MGRDDAAVREGAEEPVDDLDLDAAGHHPAPLRPTRRPGPRRRRLLLGAAAGAGALLLLGVARHAGGAVPGAGPGARAR